MQGKPGIQRGRPAGATTFEAAPAEAFGAAVRAIRTDEGIAQETLAHLAGIERSHMGKIERGEHLPTLSVVYLGTCISLGAYGLYNFGVSRLPAGQASAFINLIPVITLLMGRVLLGDQLTPQQYAASALVLVGVLLSQGRGATVPDKAAPD